jgi:type II secretory pathway pseudopilin PulG
LKFTLIRLVVAISLMLITGIALGGFLEKQGYQIQE